MKRVSRCAAQCQHSHRVNRRQFVAASSASLVSASLLGSFLQSNFASAAEIGQHGPASKYVPTVKAFFVRREGDYGMRWPGQIYDGEAARKKFIEQIGAEAKALGIMIDLQEKPIYSEEEGQQWVAQAAESKPDGLLAVMLDRQRPAWPVATAAVDSGIPTVIFSPVGTSFTTNTVDLADRTGCFICSTDDFRQVQMGIKMLKAGAKMRNTRCLVIKGKERGDSEMLHLGIKLRTVPAATFLEEYEATPIDDQVKAMAADLMKHAKKQEGPTEADVLNGIKSYLVAGRLMQREECDAITMDCLGALGKTKVSLPCIAWSKMNDDAIPAACEADLGAVATHIIVQYLLDRPGFQQDPVAETMQDAIIGAHCSCPTRLNGFGTEPEPYDIVHHHGVRDATMRPVWRVGQDVTCVDVLPGSEETPTQMLISAGKVVENVSVPPAGGCVVSVMAKFDSSQDVLSFPGFHQLFLYGNFKRELRQFCRLQGIEPVVV